MATAANLDPEPFGPHESYSTRPRTESSRDVIANRLGVTSVLFSTAMGLAYLLGRSRR